MREETARVKLRWSPSRSVLTATWTKSQCVCWKWQSAPVWDGCFLYPHLFRQSGNARFQRLPFDVNGRVFASLCRLAVLEEESVSGRKRERERDRSERATVPEWLQIGIVARTMQALLPFRPTSKKLFLCSSARFVYSLNSLSAPFPYSIRILRHPDTPAASMSAAIRSATVCADSPP